MSGVVWAVIRREYLQRVRSRWFVFATIAGPLAMAALIFVPAFMASRDQEAARTLAVVDRTGVLWDAVQERLDSAGLAVERAVDDPASLARLEARIRDGELGAYLVLDEETLRYGRAVYRTDDTPSAIRSMMLRQAVAQSALAARLQADTDEVRSLLAGGDLQVQLLDEDATEVDTSAFVVAYVGAFMLYMVILLYAVSVMRSVLQEKTNRVVEVILSSMRPFHLMLGKILGVGAVGLTQLAIWVASAVLLVGMGIPALLAARPELVELAELREAVPGVGYALLFLIFFLGGFFMYAGLYAAVGAMCNTDEEAQQAQLPVTMLLVVPIIFVTSVIQNPDAPMSVGLSYVPFFSPILMFARAAAGAAAWWEIALCSVLMGLTVLGVAWLAGRIYKVGILMAGKRPSLPELVRWVRQS